MARTLDGVFEGAVLRHQADRMLEVGVGCLGFFERAPPECPFAVRSAAEREHHRQRDLALAKIVAHVLAELGRGSPVVECIIDQLEGNAEIHAEGAAGALLVPGARSERRAHLAGGGKEFRRLGADHREIVVLGGGCILRGTELHHFPFGNNGGSRRQDFQRPERGGFDHHLESLAQPKKNPPPTPPPSPPHAGRRPRSPRRISLSSTTSSCSNVAVCMNSTAAASLTWPAPA